MTWFLDGDAMMPDIDTLLLFGTADVDGEVTSAGPAAVAATEQLSQLRTRVYRQRFGVGLGV